MASVEEGDQIFTANETLLLLRPAQQLLVPLVHAGLAPLLALFLGKLIALLEDGGQVGRGILKRIP